MANKYQGLGIDIPIYFNVYPSFEIQNWQILEEIGDLVGVDIYPSNEFQSDDSEHAKFIEKLKRLYLL